MRFIIDGGIFAQYTGTPALAILFGITLFSVPYIRHRLHAVFYPLHILFYITYLGLCFWHFGQEGDSWTYLWATLAIYLATTLTRIFWFNRTYNIRYGTWLLQPAAGSSSVEQAISVRELPDGMTRLDILPPNGFNWKAGQHVFLRLPGLSILGNHPFTIASTPSLAPPVSTSCCDKGTLEEGRLTFLIRAQAGFTRHLHRSLSNASLWQARTCHIEGPYGGLSYTAENLYDTVILVAGGGGVTVSMAWLDHLSRLHSGSYRNIMRVKKVVFAWVVRRKEHLKWASDAIADASSRTALNNSSRVGDDEVLETDFLQTSVWVTYHDGQAASTNVLEANDQGQLGSETDVEKCATVVNSPEDVSIRTNDRTRKSTNGAEYEIGRPRMAELIPSLLKDCSGQRVLVIGQ